MATYDLGRECAVCGAIIGDMNPDGVGAECRHVYYGARKVIHNQVKERAYKYYGTKARIFMPVFIEKHKDVKFRSKFKKSFYPSVVKQWEEKGFLSKKQLEICLSWLGYKIDYNTEKELLGEVHNEEKKILKTWQPTDDERDQIVKLAETYRRNLRENDS